MPRQEFCQIPGAARIIKRACCTAKELACPPGTLAAATRLRKRSALLNQIEHRAHRVTEDTGKKRDDRRR